MVNIAVPPPDLLAARRSLEGLVGLTLLEDWTWNEKSSRWILHCRLTLPVSPNGLIPLETDWYVHIDPAYPWGKIKIFPSKLRGIAETFPHQSYNGIGYHTIPWRDGDICATGGLHEVSRRVYDQEPFEVHRRLRWHLERALDWLDAASKGCLVLPGEPFELPHFPIRDLGIVAFSEDQATLEQWKQI